jgi:hypothetical protein
VSEPSITCPDCGMTSYSPGDIERGYCGNCHDFTSERGFAAKPDDEPFRDAGEARAYMEWLLGGIGRPQH